MSHQYLLRDRHIHITTAQNPAGEEDPNPTPVEIVARIFSLHG
jgi:hypothetical protein